MNSGYRTEMLLTFQLAIKQYPFELRTYAVDFNETINYAFFVCQSSGLYRSTLLFPLLGSEQQPGMAVSLCVHRVCVCICDTNAIFEVFHLTLV